MLPSLGTWAQLLASYAHERRRVKAARPDGGLAVGQRVGVASSSTEGIYYAPDRLSSRVQFFGRHRRRQGPFGEEMRSVRQLLTAGVAALLLATGAADLATSLENAARN